MKKPRCRFAALNLSFPPGIKESAKPSEQPPHNIFEISDNLFISDFDSACQPQLLKEFSIDTIINCSASSCHHPAQQSVDLLEFNILDTPDFEFIEYFEQILQKIESQLSS